MFSLLVSLFLVVSPIFPAANAGPLAPPNIESAIRGTKKHNRDAVLVIGNENYHHLPQALFAQNDMELMSDYFKNTRKLRRWKSTKLRNARAKDIEKQLKKRARSVSRSGTLWIYFGGHGYTDKEGNRFLMGIDAKSDDPTANSVELNRLIELGTKRGNRLVVIVDAGFGNTGRDGLNVLDKTDQGRPHKLPYSDPKVIVWLSDTGFGPNVSLPTAQHGLHSYLVMGALRGWADGELDNQKDGVVSLGEAQAYVANRTLQIGQANIPAIFPEEEAQKWPMTAHTLEEGPNDALIEQLSIQLRMRNYADIATRIRAQAATVWQDVLADVQRGGPDGEAALQRYMQRYERSEISLEWMVHVPEIAEARRMLRNYANLGNITDYNPEVCINPFELEAVAILGQMTKEQITCIEAKLRLERLQTEKSKLSLLLINNSYHAKDYTYWENQLRRHLQNIDRSDPDMTLAFSVFLRKKGAEYYEEALSWTEYTMETRQSWASGNQFVQKSNNLYRLRAELALELWSLAEDRYTQDRTNESDQLSREARGQAKDLSREWLDYARQAKLSTKKAFNLCMSTSEDPKFCE